MGIQKYMVIIKFSFCVLLVLHLVAAVSVIEKKEIQDGFVRELFDSVSGLVDEHTVMLPSLVTWILVALYAYSNLVALKLE
jgi:hypothetical protein